MGSIVTKIEEILDEHGSWENYEKYLKNKNMFGNSEDFSIGEQTPEYMAFCNSARNPKTNGTESFLRCEEAKKAAKIPGIQLELDYNPLGTQSFQPDSIVQTISDRFIERAKVGWNKYGTNLDRKDLSTTDWVVHLQEELHDSLVYSEKLRQDEIKRNRLLDLMLDNYNNGIDDETILDELNELQKWYYEQKKEKTTNKAKDSGRSVY